MQFWLFLEILTNPGNSLVSNPLWQGHYKNLALGANFCHGALLGCSP